MRRWYCVILVSFPINAPSALERLNTSMYVVCLHTSTLGQSSHYKELDHFDHLDQNDILEPFSIYSKPASHAPNLTFLCTVSDDDYIRELGFMCQSNKIELPLKETLRVHILNNQALAYLHKKSCTKLSSKLSFRSLAGPRLSSLLKT